MSFVASKGKEFLHHLVFSVFIALSRNYATTQRIYHKFSRFHWAWFQKKETLYVFVRSPDSSWGRKKNTKTSWGNETTNHTELPKTSDDLGTFGTVKNQPPTSCWDTPTQLTMQHLISPRLRGRCFFLPCEKIHKLHTPPEDQRLEPTNHPWKERNLIWTKPPWLCYLRSIRGASVHTIIWVM